MTDAALEKLVAQYCRENGPRIAEYLQYFQELGNLNDAIRYSCHGKEGQIHDHQYLVGKERLELARRLLQRSRRKIEISDSFEDVIETLERVRAQIPGFGVLAVYDTSLRLGAYLGKWPTVVYLHAGTKRGCKALGVATKEGTVEMDRLPYPIQALEPYQAEDFLCIFKDHFSGAAKDSRGCLPNRKGIC